MLAIVVTLAVDKIKILIYNILTITEGTIMPQTPKLAMTPEILAAIKKLEAMTGEEIDDPTVAAMLRKGAEEHVEILRRSRELGDRKVYR